MMMTTTMMIIIIIITYPPIYIKHDTEVLHIMLFINYELSDSRSNECYILLKGLKDIFPRISAFLFQFG